MTKTMALVFTAILFFFVGVLAIAVGLTLPFVAREARTSTLPDRFAAAANEAWRHQTRKRVRHCAAVTAILVAWTSFMFLA